MFEQYSDYYDYFYNDKSYKKETNYIIKLLNSNGVKKGDILEFGSGTGKHAYHLAKNGYNVEGVEISANMISKVKKHPKLRIKKGDIRKIKLNKYFKAVISLFHVISYQTTNEQIRAVFKNASRHLRPGGLFIFDVWYSPAVYHQKSSTKVKRFENKSIRIVRVAEPNSQPNKNIVEVNYNFFIENLKNSTSNQFKETHSMRHFSLPEIDYLSKEHRFQIIDAHEFLTKRVPSENTWGVCIILKKNND